MARYGDHQLDSLYFYLNSGSIWVYSFSVFFSARSWRYSTISSRWCSLLRSSWRSVVNVCSTLEPDHSAVIALRYSAAVPSPEWFSTSRHYLNSSLIPSWPYVPPSSVGVLLKRSIYWLIGYFTAIDVSLSLASVKAARDGILFLPFIHLSCH